MNPRGAVAILCPFMAKTESTAINELINLVSTATPRKPAPDEDLMFVDPKKRKTDAVSIPRMTATVPAMKGAGPVEPLPRGRGATGTAQNAITPVRITTAPPARGSSIPPLAMLDDAELDVEVEVDEETPAPPTERMASKPALNGKFDLSATSSIGHNLPQSSIGILVPPAPIAPKDPKPRAPTPSPAPADMTTDQPWFENTAAADRSSAPRDEQTWVGTQPTPRQRTTAQWLKMFAPWMVVMVVVGGLIGGYVAFSTKTKKTDAPGEAPSAVVTMPAPTPAPVAAVADEPKVEMKVETKTDEPAVAAPIAPPAERPVFADIRIDSNPAGATVTLIDRDKHMFIGTTPIATSVDVSREYDVELSYPNRPAITQHLDPKATTKLSVEIHRAHTAETPKAAAAPVAAKAEQPKAAPVAAVVKEALPKVETPKPAEPTGEGVLMISSKPPCEILIDGKPTGLMTPQRSLPLPAGTHKVTLVNAADKIKKTLTIQISPDQPTKVIQDLMAN